jgi:hypothetical protein
MIIKSTLAFASAALFIGLAAAPASAKTSISRGSAICRTAILAQTPAPKAARPVTDDTRVNNDRLVFRFRVKGADDSVSNVICTVNRDTDEATLAAE